MITRPLADLGAFCARLVRFDSTILVRISSGAIWAWLPFDVLVTRPIAAVEPDLAAEGTYRAGEVLGWLSGAQPPVNRDHEWRGAVPRATGRTLDVIPAGEIRRIAAAAAETLRTAPPTLGERRVRDALLDHVAVTVTSDPASGGTAGEDRGTQAVERAEVPVRLVVALTRMDFLGSQTPGADDLVAVRRSGGWTGLAASYGAAWYRQSLTL